MVDEAQLLACPVAWPPPKVAVTFRVLTGLQQSILHASQSNCLAVQHHHAVAQMHEQVFITIELLVQGWQKRLWTQSAAILHGVRTKQKPR